MIHYRNDVRASGIDGRALKSVARRLMSVLGEADASLSLWIVGDARMRELNRAHRGKDRSTDVLSFASRSEPSKRLPKDPVLGDIIISAQTAKRQAAAYDAPIQREMERLLIHGMLHLVGHDHELPAERRRMRAQERRLARSIGMPWPY